MNSFEEKYIQRNYDLGSSIAIETPLTEIRDEKIAVKKRLN